ncbi:MAG: ATP-binding cassette domain-containing protein [Chitinophagia bacterium]|jgi:ABC-2 type transport system ATP-binding protein
MSLVVEQLCKSYDSQLAVDRVSFHLKQGEVVGFLGPNGAGKSTTLKMIAGFLSPDSGSIQLNGMPIHPDTIEAKKIIGYLPESNALYEQLYVKEYLQFLSKVHGIQNASQRILQTIDQTGLGLMQHKKIGSLSKGYKQRLGIAAAILHQPKLVLLDEPTTGLDPNQLIEIRALIQSLSKEALILFSTHILQEVTAICDRVLVLHQGKLVADEPIGDLLKKHNTNLEEIFKLLTH